MTKKWLGCGSDLKDKVDDIITQADNYHKQYYDSEVFTGPSLHFHQRALAASQWDEKVELIYAVLTSWGMHRMGKAGSKMQPFDKFKKSMDEIKSEVENLQGVTPEQLTDHEWQKIKCIFNDITVMASETTLVGNSKVMAHLMPELIAPIDRQYTLLYLFNRTSFKNNKEREWKLLRKIHEEFFHIVVKDENSQGKDKSFQEKAEEWMAGEKYPWNTSVLKIVDNLVIGAIRKAKSKVL